jgi:hypothetical protein
MGDSVLLLSSQISHVTVEPWRGSLGVRQPLTWFLPPDAGYWTPVPWGPYEEAFLIPLSQPVPGHWPPPPCRVPPKGQVSPWAPTPRAHVMPYGMPPCILQQ